MDGQPAAVLVVRLFTQEIEKLRVDQRDQEVKGAVGVRHDEEQRRLPVSQGVQLQLVVGRDVPQFLDVKGRQSGTAGNQDGFGGLAGGQLVELILPHREAVGLVALQGFKRQVHLILVAVVIFVDFHHVQKIHERGEVLLLLGGFLPDKGNQGGVEELFTLLPELVPGFSVSLGVGNQSSDKFQNVLFTVEIHKGVIMETFLEVNGVEHLDAVGLPDDASLVVQQHLSILAPLGRPPLKQRPALQ